MQGHDVDRAMLLVAEGGQTRIVSSGDGGEAAEQAPVDCSGLLYHERGGQAWLQIVESVQRRRGRCVVQEEEVARDTAGGFGLQTLTPDAVRGHEALDRHRQVSVAAG